MENTPVRRSPTVVPAKTATSVGAVLAGIALATVGASMAWGIGIGLVILGVALAAVGVLIGMN